MKTVLLFPGRIKPAALAAAQADYARRLAPFGVEWIEYKDAKVAAGQSAQAKEADACRILGHLKAGDYLVACDERGKGVRTREVAGLLRAARGGEVPLAGRRRLVVAIGGAHGLADAVLGRADAVWSLSPLVLAGGVARIVLLEALYRAFTLVEGHPYHNE
jgi:23S rRNA (pseudouridine1915-N3)-methyltransferase